MIYKGISVIDLLFYLLNDLFGAYKDRHWQYIAYDNKFITLYADQYFKQFKTSIRSFKNDLIKCINENKCNKLLTIDFTGLNETHEIIPGDMLCDISLNFENENEIDQLITLYKMKGFL